MGAQPVPGRSGRGLGPPLHPETPELRSRSVQWSSPTPTRRMRACAGGAVRVTVPLPTVTQLQMTLASVQELLLQQQQKVQELAHELATAKVLPPPRAPWTVTGGDHTVPPEPSLSRPRPSSPSLPHVLSTAVGGEQLSLGGWGAVLSAAAPPRSPVEEGCRAKRSHPHGAQGRLVPTLSCPYFLRATGAAGQGSFWEPQNHLQSKSIRCMWGDAAPQHSPARRAAPVQLV